MDLLLQNPLISSTYDDDKENHEKQGAFPEISSKSIHNDFLNVYSVNKQHSGQTTFIEIPESSPKISVESTNHPFQWISTKQQNDEYNHHHHHHHYYHHRHHHHGHNYSDGQHHYHSYEKKNAVVSMPLLMVDDDENIDVNVVHVPINNNDVYQQNNEQPLKDKQNQIEIPPTFNNGYQDYLQQNLAFPESNFNFNQMFFDVNNMDSNDNYIQTTSGTSSNLNSFSSLQSVVSVSTNNSDDNFPIIGADGSFANPNLLDPSMVKVDGSEASNDRNEIIKKANENLEQTKMFMEMLKSMMKTEPKTVKDEQHSNVDSNGQSHENRSTETKIIPIDNVQREILNHVIRPPVRNRNYQEARYKTELCLHYREHNNCPHGVRCLFAHGLQELRPYRGRHPKHKTQQCKAFHEQGFCNYGYRCSYIHSESPRTIEYIKRLNYRAQVFRRNRQMGRPDSLDNKEYKFNINIQQPSELDHTLFDWKSDNSSKSSLLQWTCVNQQFGQ